MRLVLSRLALAELDEVLGGVAERSPLGAAHVEARLRGAFDLIVRHPEAAQQGEQRPDVRRLPLVRFPYVIYYEVAQDEGHGAPHSARGARAAIGQGAVKEEAKG